MTTTSEYTYDDLEAGDEVMVRRAGPNKTEHVTFGKVSERHVFGECPQIITAFGIFDANRALDTFELLRRAKPALPDRPGTVGLATINGRRVRVMLVQDGSGTRVWACASPTVPDPISGVYLAGDEAISDFVRLDVVDPETGKLA
jgi:hypothetical protein